MQKCHIFRAWNQRKWTFNNISHAKKLSWKDHTKLGSLNSTFFFWHMSETPPQFRLPVRTGSTASTLPDMLQKYRNLGITWAGTEPVISKVKQIIFHWRAVQIWDRRVMGRLFFWRSWQLTYTTLVLQRKLDVLAFRVILLPGVSMEIYSTHLSPLPSTSYQRELLREACAAVSGPILLSCPVKLGLKIADGWDAVSSSGHWG